MLKRWAGLALAVPAGSAHAQTLVTGPEPDRLTVGGVVANASTEVQVAMLLLALSALVALATWAWSFRQADARSLAGSLGRLRIVRSGGAPLGAMAASYTLLCMFIGMANVRPTPAVSVLAPGWAEAAMALMLGLLATTVAVLCERHLEGRIRQAAA